MSNFNIKSRLIYIFCCLIGTASSALLAEPPIPEYTPASPVVDQTGVLNGKQRQALSAKLRSFKKENGAEIAVLIIPRLDGANLEKYSIQVARRWELGSLRANDGVLFLVVLEDRKMRIEVGTDLERKLSNSRCRRILDNTITPLFKQNRYSQGINAGLKQIIDTIKSQNLSHLPDDGGENKISARDDYRTYLGFIPAGILFVFFFYFIFRIAFKAKGGGPRAGINSSVYQSWGGSLGGYGGGGGDSSSGGGSFGGGGASGGW